MILLLSGGMDSIAAWRLLRLPDAINFDLGTKPHEREQEALAWAQFRFGRTYRKRPLPIGEHEKENGYLPYRNPMLILAAAQIDPVVCIGQIAEWAPDKSRKFYRRLERTVNVPGQLAKFDKRLLVIAPFAGLSKGELIAKYCDKFGPLETSELLRHTWSCYGDGVRHCGQCGGCVQRFNAEAHFAKLTGVSINDALSNYERVPNFVPTPSQDKARWVRDNGIQGVQQIYKRWQQNRSAKELHRALVPDVPPPVPFKSPTHQR
jgi:7-cyano-7-deazaguanine synthase in queuosine biosynthesis